MCRVRPVRLRTPCPDFEAEAGSLTPAQKALSSHAVAFSDTSSGVSKDDEAASPSCESRAPPAGDPAPDAWLAGHLRLPDVSGGVRARLCRQGVLTP